MTDITELLRSALDDEPPLLIEAGETVRRGRTARRRARAGWTAAATVGVLGAGAFGAVLLAGTPTHTHRQPSLQTVGGFSAASGRHPSTTKVTLRKLSHRPKVVAGAGVTTATLPGLVEQSTGVTLLNTQVSSLPPDGSLDLAAALDLTGHPYLNVQVLPAADVDPKADTCADLNTLSSPNSDGYTGACSATTLSDGSLLITRTGATTTGGYTKAQASLILTDGTDIVAENTNQTAVLDLGRGSGNVHASDGKPAVGAVISPQPGLDAGTMAQLVEDIAAAE